MPKLTTLPQLNGNISAIADTSKNMSRQVMSIESSAENIINRNRPSNGSKNNPTCTVPAEHSVNKHAADDNCGCTANIDRQTELFVVERMSDVLLYNYKL